METRHDKCLPDSLCFEQTCFHDTPLCEQGFGLNATLQQHRFTTTNSEGGLNASPPRLLFRINLQYTMRAANRLLTGSGQQCVLPHTPSATCALAPAG